jgi:hypothetical protein
MAQPRIIQSNALPPPTTLPLEPGASSIFDSAIIKQQNQNMVQNALAKTGGYRRKRTQRGSGPQVLVPPAPSYALNPVQTNDINAKIMSLAVNNQNNSAFDGTVNGSQADAAKIASEQQAIYNGKGGKRSTNSRQEGGKRSTSKRRTSKRRTKRIRRTRRTKRTSNRTLRGKRRY